MYACIRLQNFKSMFLVLKWMLTLTVISIKDAIQYVRLRAPTTKRSHFNALFVSRAMWNTLCGLRDVLWLTYVLYTTQPTAPLRLCLKPEPYNEDLDTFGLGYVDKTRDILLLVRSFHPWTNTTSRKQTVLSVCKSPSHELYLNIN